MFSDFSFIFYWWFWLFILGVLFLPLTFFIFSRFFDKGYLLAKIISLLIVSYLIWLLGSFKILPFTNGSLWLVILSSAGFNFWLFSRNKKKLKKIILKKWPLFAFQEALFLVTLVFWTWVRGFQPNIEGLEKFMDFGFVNAILRTRFFPPPDMWLAGETINYYYFGHLISAVLTKITNLEPAVAYNLLIATLFAFTFSLSFSLTANLFFLSDRCSKLLNIKLKFLKRERFLPWSFSNRKVKILTAGLLTAFLLTLGANLHPLYWFLKNKSFENYWYPDATRFVVEKFGAGDNTIHEFPIYSFVVADLHGHLINLPNVLLILALNLLLARKIFKGKKIKFLDPPLVMMAFCLAIAFMSNAWDYPVYLLLAGLVFLIFSSLKESTWLEIFKQVFLLCFQLLIFSFLFVLPFMIGFENIAQGMAPVDFHSPPWMLLVLWGLPLVISFLFFVFLFLAWRRNLLFKLNFGDYWLIALFLLAWMLILIPELVYVKDIYIQSHQRANTMFKLTYQSFVMFGIATGYFLTRFFAFFKNNLLKTILFLILAPLLASALIYPRFAIRSYYGMKTYHGLNGLEYLKTKYPDDYLAVLWLQKNVEDQPVIAEAVGESYTHFARVSANTGLPTILGWRVHEWLWRGSFDEAGKRSEEVQRIYQSTDLETTKSLLNQYQVKYLFLGALEREAYPQIQKEKFANLGEIIFASGQTKIYEIN